MIDHSTRLLALKLIERGAVLQIGNLLALVGHWDWLDDQRAFWFEAGGDSEFAAHVLHFDHATSPHKLGVEFRDADGELVGYLTTIKEAVDDPKPYTEAFTAWCKDAPGLKSFIHQIRAALESQQYLFFYASAVEAERILESGFDPMAEYAELLNLQAGATLCTTAKLAKEMRPTGTVMLRATVPFKLPEIRRASPVFVDFDRLAWVAVRVWDL